MKEYLRMRVYYHFCFLRTKYRFMKNPFRLVLYEIRGKRYLTVIRTNFKGVKWIRRFEIVTELNPVSLEPIEFKGEKLTTVKQSSER